MTYDRSTYNLYIKDLPALGVLQARPATAACAWLLLLFNFFVNFQNPICINSLIILLWFLKFYALFLSEIYNSDFTRYELVSISRGKKCKRKRISRYHPYLSNWLFISLIKIEQKKRMKKRISRGITSGCTRAYLRIICINNFCMNYLNHWRINNLHYLKIWWIVCHSIWISLLKSLPIKYFFNIFTEKRPHRFFCHNNF